MEVTPHLKSVLKNYQYSATKSLQGPGQSLHQLSGSSGVKCEIPSPNGGSDEEFQPIPVPFPVQQVPILTAPDTTCSERTETILEGEAISCFVVGGEKRLCLPQVLNSVLRDFSLVEINRECDLLQIYCSRCTPEQLNVLKSQGILPSVAPSCGLITQTDAERLCSALLFSGTKNLPFRPRRGASSFPVYHECFGKTQGRCYPELYTSRHAKCFECSECQCGFSPQQFVSHVHRSSENRTVHWGFDSSNHWRSYLHLPDNQAEQDSWNAILDELKDRYDGKVAYPPPLLVEGAAKRKQIAASDLVKDHQASLSELPLKKQKLDDCYGLNRVAPFPLTPFMQQQMGSAMKPVYIQRYFQEINTIRQLNAYKPVVQTIREQKLRSANALGMATKVTADPPLLQDPEKVVLLSESERFERSYQPNVTLAPMIPKKHRYGRFHETRLSNGYQSQGLSASGDKSELLPPSKTDAEPSSGLTNGHIKEESEAVPMACSPEKPPTSPVPSVPQANNVNGRHVPPLKYNPEIELSTDTEDSSSETSSDKPHLDHSKYEEQLKAAKDDEVRNKALELCRMMAEEHERVMLRLQEEIVELKRKHEALKMENDQYRMEVDQYQMERRPASGSDLVSSSSLVIVQSPSLEKAESLSPPPPAVLVANNHAQKSVIASVCCSATTNGTTPQNETKTSDEEIAQEEGAIVNNTTPE